MPWLYSDWKEQPMTIHYLCNLSRCHWWLKVSHKMEFLGEELNAVLHMIYLGDVNVHGTMWLL